MKADVLFSGVATADLAAAVGWYESLFGRPADIIVNDDEVMWQVCEGGWLYLVQDASRAGQALVAIAVADLDAALEGAVGRGLARPLVNVLEGGERKAPMIDPEGNTVALIEVPAPPEH